ncbi:TPA: DUF550 domain-containing protein [Klebsiella pneumoniae]|nr:DUF550 domain-containing protein [Klebsiella pneumoniae]
MTKSTITREQLEEWVAQFDEDGGCDATDRQLEALIRQSLAAMDSEPVVKKVACWSCQNEVEIAAISDCDGCCPKCGTRIHLDEEPYIAPLSAPDRDQVRQEHAEWSQATFGNVGPVGPLKHLSKEALEAADQPGDLSEWADMQFLMWDAQRRAGITDEQITQAMFDKLAVNKRRSWPEPKDGEPRLHIKEQPAPVVPDDYQRLRELYHAQEKRLFKIAQRIKGPTFDKYSHSPSQAIDVLEGAIFGEDGACRAAMLAADPQLPGSDPATVPGKWIPVSERIPDNTEPVLCIEKRADFGTYGQPFVCWHDGGGWVGKTNYRPIVTHWMPLPADPQEVK